MVVADDAGSPLVEELGGDDPGVALILVLQRAGADESRTRQAEADLLAETQNSPRECDPFPSAGETVSLLDEPSSGPPMFVAPLAFAAPPPDCGQALFAG